MSLSWAAAAGASAATTSGTRPASERLTTSIPRLGTPGSFGWTGRAALSQWSAGSAAFYRLPADEVIDDGKLFTRE